MPKPVHDSYDAIIIGAGISGLVCGCYLAKAGMKVLIVEQHHQPGGYCTSFKRQGFTFDAAAHSFGGYREGGVIKRVLRELGLDSGLDIKRYDPSDRILSPDFAITFWSDINRTSHEIQTAFPHETGGINDFFRFLRRSQPFDLVPLRNKTFRDFLNHFFTDERLKSILSFPVLGNGGLPPSQMCAFTAVKIYTEFLLDGGYYPDTSMQDLSNAFAERFKMFGGELQLSCPAQKIKVADGTAVGVILDNNRSVWSRYVVSDCDARQTYYSLLGPQVIDKETLDRIGWAVPSLSVFVAYLGIDKYFDQLPEPGVNVWVMPHYDIDELFRAFTDNEMTDSTGFMMRVSPNKRTLLAFANASFKDHKFWSQNKYVFLQQLIDRIQTIVPGLASHIIYQEAGTPHTMYRYTRNYKGAAYGWASTPSQFTDPALTTNAVIPSLYIAGHWSGMIQGIPGVAYRGLTVANSILRKTNGSKHNAENN